MSARNDILRIFFLSQTAVGTLGNSFLLVLYTITFFAGHKLRPIDIILTHLAFVNNLVLLSKGIPYTMSGLGLIYFMNDFICKFISYLHRVARGLSLSTTCLLGSVQAITISSGSSMRGQLKTQFPKYIFPFILLCWIFHFLTNYTLFESVIIPKISNNVTKIIDFGFCTSVSLNSVNISLYFFLMSLFDIICVAIMVWTGGYMIFFLHRLYQQIGYIHSSKLTPRGTPKTRATQTILILVSFFVCFYSINSVFSWYMYYIYPLPWMASYSAFLAACFPAFSPFVLIINDSQVSAYFLVLWRMVKPQSCCGENYNGLFYRGFLQRSLPKGENLREFLNRDKKFVWSFHPSAAK